jgi:L-fucose isomerase-like protein
LVASDTSRVRKLHALQGHHQLPEGIAAAELRLVELGIDVVVVEDELLAEQLEEAADEEEQVRRLQAWITSKPRVKSTRQQQDEGPEERDSRYSIA